MTLKPRCVLAHSLALLLLAPGALAAVPVEESAPNEGIAPAAEERTPPPEEGASGAEAYPAGESVVEVYGAAAPSPNRGPSSPVTPFPERRPPSGTGLATLYRQIQVLQQELQTLRGLLEEQGFQIERLARDQKAQYVDLDQRIVALRQGGGAQPPGTGLGPGAGAQPQPGGAPPPVAGAGLADAGAGPDERQAYAAAFNLMEGRAFADAVAGFQKVLADYPNGQYAPNCYYWLGELFLVQNEIEDARQNFVQVVQLYPDHSKVADALYKLGVIYHRLDDNQRALEHLNRVRNDHPDSSAADLAARYAAELL